MNVAAERFSILFTTSSVMQTENCSVYHRKYVTECDTEPEFFLKNVMRNWNMEIHSVLANKW